MELRERKYTLIVRRGDRVNMDELAGLRVTVDNRGKEAKQGLSTLFFYSLSTFIS